jgi:hypothetical protein
LVVGESNCTEEPQIFILSAPALMVTGFTVTSLVSDVEQPVEVVIVTVYVVVELAEQIGLAIVSLFRPVEGVHL